MEGKSAKALASTQRDQQWESLRYLIHQLEEESDLEGMAAVSEMGLTALRQMCERPTTCEALDQMLEMLRELDYDFEEMEKE